MAHMLVYFFGGGHADGSAGMKELLGGKGAGLAEMVNLGIPVPPGFTITTEVCTHYYENGRRYPDQLRGQVEAALGRIEQIAGARFGDPKNPLLVSVRSGARASMPGMMDTVLNLGLNDRTVRGLAEHTGNPRFAFDSYRRFVAMYGDVVMGLKPERKEDRDPFEVILEDMKRRRGVDKDHELSATDLEELVERFKAEIRSRLGHEFPEEPTEQLWGAIGAVFGSWENKRAVEYRRIYNIPAEWGTAVNVQAMVFGNMGEDCATGVAFTRDPATGAKRAVGEYLINAQGEDVVAGIRTPARLAGDAPDGPPTLERAMPGPYRELLAVFERLERHYRDMQDVEFTIQKGKLWVLQTRAGKRTALAMVRTAVEMAEEGLIERPQALVRIEAARLPELLVPVLDEKSAQEARAAGRVIAKGLAASRGGAVGKVVLHADDAIERAKAGEKVILVRWETSPEDVHGMHAAAGILTATGGMTSHAAVVARGMGKCCVVGASGLQIDYQKGQFSAGGKTVRAGEVITIDGGSGEVFLGEVLALPAPPSEHLKRLLGWADELRRLRVRANGDTPDDARRARAFGAEGIGLCRTEHMFFEPARILAVREMIFAETAGERRRALEKILPMQRGDFVAILREMAGLPVTIRLLDPPLHEFLPQERADIEELARALQKSTAEVAAKNRELHEQNPMLGHRGCRLAVTYPEIYEMQARAIAEAAAQLAEAGVDVRPEIMIPIVGHPRELEKMRALVTRAVGEVLTRARAKIDYTVGTMIELPRACVVADTIAAQADFFSFGTNDLTQTTLGMSRDDAGRFLPAYVQAGIYPVDPFVELDQEGVGGLMKLAATRARAAKPTLKLGICGEHGGDPSSIKFCHALGLDYVSCSPFRVYTARVAAAQAALEAPAKGKQPS
ncbi:MAG TPA: pyruvate, phosphate dikinase [Polyangia bacterium]|nr:pyruvate, phosphate dikinase [Polyangia bacterium]